MGRFAAKITSGYGLFKKDFMQRKKNEMRYLSEAELIHNCDEAWEVHVTIFYLRYFY